eukprot:3143038-Amphidinium_carterae.1
MPSSLKGAQSFVIQTTPAPPKELATRGNVLLPQTLGERCALSPHTQHASVVFDGIGSIHDYMLASPALEVQSTEVNLKLVQHTIVLKEYLERQELLQTIDLTRRVKTS